MMQAVMMADEFRALYKDHNDYENLVLFCQLYNLNKTVWDHELRMPLSSADKNDCSFVYIRDKILYEEAIPRGLVVKDEVDMFLENTNDYGELLDFCKSNGLEYLFKDIEYVEVCPGYFKWCRRELPITLDDGVVFTGWADLGGNEVVLRMLKQAIKEELRNAGDLPCQNQAEKINWALVFDGA